MGFMGVEVGGEPIRAWNRTNSLTHIRTIMKIYSYWFDLPLYSIVPYITERLQLETDFINEANNSEKMAELVSKEPRLKGRVYIPKIYRELSSKHVMTAEWIEGVRLWDKQTLTAPWKGGNIGSPGTHGTPLNPPDQDVISATLKEPGHRPESEKFKPERNAW